MNKMKIPFTYIVLSILITIGLIVYGKPLMRAIRDTFSSKDIPHDLSMRFLESTTAIDAHDVTIEEAKE